MLVEMVLWPVLDSGRIATCIWGRGYAKTRLALLRLQMNTLRELLNVSSRAQMDGVIGETGCLLDLRRAELALLQAYRRAWQSPSDSIPFQLVSAEFRLPNGSWRPPCFEQIAVLCDVDSLSHECFLAPNARTIIKRKVYIRAPMGSKRCIIFPCPNVPDSCRLGLPTVFRSSLLPRTHTDY